ncbi:MAG: ankyrin repeat domain-containing protein [Cyanobacteria bacterium P01_A01_bin.83]
MNSKQNEIKNQLIHQLSKTGDVLGLKELLVKNPTLVNAQDSVGMTPLHYAARKSVECVNLLIKGGADVNLRNRNGYTVIFEASTAEIANILVENGANINVVANRGTTPLISAICREHIDVVCYLISQGANVNYTQELDFHSTITQDSLRMIRSSDSQAKKDRAFKILEVLLEAGADPNIQCVDGSTVLHDASRKGLTEFVELLLKYGADPCIRHVGKKSCFETASDFPEILQLFEPYKHNLKPVIEVQDSPERLIERLLKIGFVDRSQFQPCSEAEIRDLEIRNRVQLPESYKKFLRIMGKGAGYFLKSDHWEVFYADFNDWLGVDFYKIPEAEYDQCTQQEIDFSLSVPDNFFVFATRLGDYPLGFFADGIDQDPDIYLLEYESELELWGETFWKFFQEMVEHYEYYCDSSKFSKTAVPWSANYKSI